MATDMTTDTTDMSTEMVSIVDSSDAITAAMPRAEMRRRQVIHRVTYILVFSAGGEVLVQRRTADKDWYPGRLDFAAGGVVQAGESYAASAARELHEELGVTPPLTACFDLWFEDAEDTDEAAHAAPTRSWGRVFSCAHDGPFRLQPAEVAAVEFMPVAAALAIPPAQVTPDSRQALAAYVL